jgi:hypothetical protein
MCCCMPACPGSRRSRLTLTAQATIRDERITQVHGKIASMWLGVFIDLASTGVAGVVSDLQGGRVDHVPGRLVFVDWRH